MKIVLIGYMASGKTTIGKFLAARTYLPFLDLDEYIEEQEEMSVSEIFADKGEIYFRRKEHEYLKQLLNSKEDFVLSLGGGTPCYAGNMDVVLQSEATSIYLDASIGLIVERLIKHRHKRPLVADISEEDLQEFIAKHLFERRPFYMQAHQKVKMDGKDVSEIVAEIRMLLY